MTYPNPAIQVQYNRYQDRGRLGAPARLDNNVVFYDTATAGVDLLPGQGVYLDTSVGLTTGQWILPASDAEGNLVTHIVSFDPSALNFDITPQNGNSSSEVKFPANTPLVKAMRVGAITLNAGADILRGQAVVYQQSSTSYVLNTLTGNKIRLIALEDASNGSLFAARLSQAGE